MFSGLQLSKERYDCQKQACLALRSIYISMCRLESSDGQQQVQRLDVLP